MEVKLLRYPSDEDWLLARNDALETHRQETDKVPSRRLKTKFLASEHSPIRGLEYRWKWIDIPYWIAMHFRTHHIGIVHFISSQRNDIQKLIDRRKAPQDALVNHRIIINAQAIINVSRARTCFTASNETREAWDMALNAIKMVTPELYALCVPHCIYRNGICPELFSKCRYNESERFHARLEEYRKNFTKKAK